MRPRFRRTCVLISTLAITLTLAPRTTLAHGHAGWVIWHGGWTGTSSFVPQVFGMPATTMVYTPTALGTGVVPVVPFSSISFVPQNSFGTTGVVPQVPFGTSSIASVPIGTSSLSSIYSVPSSIPVASFGVPTMTGMGTSGSELDRYLAFRGSQAGRASIASLQSSPEFEIASKNYYTQLASISGGTAELSQIGQFLKQFIGSPVVHQIAEKLFFELLQRQFPFIPFDQIKPLIDNFIRDLSGSGNAKQPPVKGPSLGDDKVETPLIPNLGDKTMTIHVILVGEDGKPVKFGVGAPTPAAPLPGVTSFLAKDKITKVLDATAGKYEVDREGKTVQVTGPAKLLEDDVIVLERQNGYIVRRGSTVLMVDSSGTVTKSKELSSIFD